MDGCEERIDAYINPFRCGRLLLSGSYKLDYFHFTNEKGTVRDTKGSLFHVMASLAIGH